MRPYGTHCMAVDQRHYCDNNLYNYPVHSGWEYRKRRACHFDRRDDSGDGGGIFLLSAFSNLCEGSVESIIPQVLMLRERIIRWMDLDAIIKINPGEFFTGIYI